MNERRAQSGRVGRLLRASPRADTDELEEALDRLELLTPEVMGGPRDPLTYALAYVERYQCDVLQLEQEWAFLVSALRRAWHTDSYAAVKRLAARLAPAAGRRHDLAEAEHVLRLGIAASRSTQDVRQLGYFLNRLGYLLYSHGKYHEGRHLWQTSFGLGESVERLTDLWQPLSSFTQTADILAGYEEAQRFVEHVTRVGCDDGGDSLAVAMFIRGLFARSLDRVDSAYDDFSTSLRLLSQHPSSSAIPAQRQLFMMAVQTEFARVQNQYERAQAYSATALSLAETYSDNYTVATLLIDQGQFVSHHIQLADMRATAAQLRRIARQTHASHIHTFSRILAQRVMSATPEVHDELAHRDDARLFLVPAQQRPALSEREREVLRLIAEGLSNRDIAARLVVTTGTVKKHLEHIYRKLGTNSRTSAIARARLLGLVA